MKDNTELKLIMTIPSINIHSAAAIISEIDDISKFSRMETFASYAGLVPRKHQSRGYESNVQQNEVKSVKVEGSFSL